jgi:hypothetical protein
MPTTNMSLNEPSVGQTSGPDWATDTNANWETLDAHDHTSGKGVQLTPSALNINSDVEFNQNSATELKNMIFDSSVTPATTSYSVYQSGGDLYWRNGSGTAVQITSGSNVRTTGGSIDGMSGNDSEAAYGSGIFTWQYDSTKTPFAGAKFSHADINLYKYDGSSGSNAYVILKYTGSSAGSNNLTFPDETGTILSTATSFAGAISIGATGGSGSITLDAAQDINLDSDTGVLTFKDGGTAIGKISNSSSDLVIENEVDAKDIIFKQYDGNEVVRMADDRRLYFFDKGGEYIVGDGTDLTVASGGALNLTATTDVVVPANVGITFGTGEKIEGDNTDLTLTSGADINLTATADVNLPNDVGLVFGDDGEKIEGDGTDLTIASSGEINVNSGTLDLSAQTVDVTLNGAVDALNFDSNTLSIDASNNRVGIGTAAPQHQLHIKGSGGQFINIESDDGDAFIYLDEDGANNAGVIFNESGTEKARLYMAGSDESLRFRTAGTDRVKIDSSGDVGIIKGAYNSTALSIHHSAHAQNRGLVMGQVTAELHHISNQTDAGDVSSIRLNYVGYEGGTGNFRDTYICDGKNNSIVFVDGSSSEVIFYNPNASTAAPSLQIYNTAAGSYKAKCYSDGDWENVNNSYGSLSDIRLKENIKDATSKLDEINNLRVVNFNFKNLSDVRQIGFIGQEVKKIFPSLCPAKDTREIIQEGQYEVLSDEEKAKYKLSEDGKWCRTKDGEILGYEDSLSLKTSVLIPILVKAVQELSAKVTALEGA